MHHVRGVVQIQRLRRVVRLDDTQRAGVERIWLEGAIRDGADCIGTAAFAWMARLLRLPVVYIPAVAVVRGVAVLAAVIRRCQGIARTRQFGRRPRAAALDEQTRVMAKCDQLCCAVRVCCTAVRAQADPRTRAGLLTCPGLC